MFVHPVEAALSDLERWPAGSDGVLSLYLLTDPSTAAGRHARTRWHELVRALKERAEASEGVAAIEAASRAGLAQLAALDVPPRSVAVFSCPPRGLLKVLPLPLRVPSSADWAPTPDLRPLREALAEHERILVVLIDREHARLCRVLLDAIVEVDLIKDFVPARRRGAGGAWHAPAADFVQGEGARARIERHADVLLQRHARHAAEAVADLVAAERVDRVVVGGTPEALAAFRAHLPRPVRRRVAGTIRLPLTTPAEAILEAVRNLLEPIERAADDHLIDDLTDASAAGLAVFGLDQVVAAAASGAVDRLVYADGSGVAGGWCPGCALLSVEPDVATCPACGRPLKSVPDLLAYVIDRVSEQGGRVEHVRGRAATRLRARGTIAAFLRYPLDSAVPAEGAALTGTATGPAGEGGA